MMMFSFGIEHEVAFLNREGKFADFTRTKFVDFQQIIAKLPTYPHDYLHLHIGDAGIRQKRWYIEGFERFADSDQVIDCIPKGIEIRTTIHSSIQGAINELTESFRLLREVANTFGFTPILSSFNPYNSVFQPQPPLNDYEIKLLQAYPDEQTANIYMVTCGPDLNISLANLAIENLIDIGRKLTYYSPFIIPFTYSSPFYQGNLWSGLSVRTFIRNGKRPATLVYVEKEEQLIKSTPSLTKVARIPAERGRIEFKSCDSCDDFNIYAGLLALLKGLVLDKKLLERSHVPDIDLHQTSAKLGFDNAEIFSEANHILQAAETALATDPDVQLLTTLKNILIRRKSRSHDLVEIFQRVGSIEETLKMTYQV
jgi:gamma-glutamyl:cysteine ligase YbdK (ATP-grasp superfamily)